MSLKDKLIKLLNLKRKPVFLVVPESPYEIAFECGGRTYYRYLDEKGMPYLRWAACLDIFQQMEFKLDKAYLQAYFEAVVVACNNGKMSDVVVLTNNAKDALNYVTNTMLMYQLAAVMYIDMEHENPNEYDPVFAEEKIKHWMQHKEVESFFLSKPIINWLPPVDIFNGSIQDYIQKETLVRIKNLKNISHVLSYGQNETDTKQSTLNQVEMWELLKKYQK